MRIAPINPLLLSASVSSVPPRFLEAVRSAISNGNYCDQVGPGRVNRTRTVREISIYSDFKQNSRHEFRLSLETLRFCPSIALKVDVYRSIHHDPDEGKSLSAEDVPWKVDGLAEASSDAYPDPLVLLEALRRGMGVNELFSLPIEEVMELSVRYIYGFAEAAEVFLNLPN